MNIKSESYLLFDCTVSSRLTWPKRHFWIFVWTQPQTRTHAFEKMHLTYSGDKCICIWSTRPYEKVQSSEIWHTKLSKLSVIIRLLDHLVQRGCSVIRWSVLLNSYWSYWSPNCSRCCIVGVCECLATTYKCVCSNCYFWGNAFSDVTHSKI